MSNPQIMATYPQPTDIEQDTHLAKDENGDPRFWIVDLDDSIPENAAAMNLFGEGETVGIVDEREGGIIAYAHESNAQRIVHALAVTFKSL